MKYIKVVSGAIIYKITRFYLNINYCGSTWFTETLSQH